MDDSDPKNLTTAKPTGPLTPEEMEELQRQMLRNLSDPEVAKRVDAAEVQRYEETQKSAGRRLAEKGRQANRK